MGTVYRAQHEVTHRRIALKLLPHDVVTSRETSERFLREARTTGELHHPGIVEIIDAGEDSEHGFYLVMELLQGEALEARLTAPLATDFVLRIADQLLAALSAAHERGIIHRDVKPANVMISAEGTLKLIDFGIARVHSDSQRVTRTGATLGTPAYVSPEQKSRRSRPRRTHRSMVRCGATFISVFPTENYRSRVPTNT